MNALTMAPMIAALMVAIAAQIIAIVAMLFARRALSRSDEAISKALLAIDKVVSSRASRSAASLAARTPMRTSNWGCLAGRRTPCEPRQGEPQPVTSPEDATAFAARVDSCAFSPD